MKRFLVLTHALLLGRADANIAFGDIRGLLLALGFAERVRGNHHIFTRNGMEEILNLQPVGAKAKPYQIRQVRNTILSYKLACRNGPQIRSHHLLESRG